jgi:hypothetical protein
MGIRFGISRGQALDRLDSRMRHVSLVVSVIALALALVGFAQTVVGERTLSLPGEAALMLRHLPARSAGGIESLVLMSAGILLLGLLPVIRILVSAWLYARSASWKDLLAALLVLGVMAFSIRLSV